MLMKFLTFNSWNIKARQKLLPRWFSKASKVLQGEAQPVAHDACCASIFQSVLVGLQLKVEQMVPLSL